MQVGTAAHCQHVLPEDTKPVTHAIQAGTALVPSRMSDLWWIPHPTTPHPTTRATHMVKQGALSGPAVCCTVLRVHRAAPPKASTLPSQTHLPHTFSQHPCPPKIPPHRTCSALRKLSTLPSVAL